MGLGFCVEGGGCSCPPVPKSVSKLKSGTVFGPGGPSVPKSVSKLKIGPVFGTGSKLSEASMINGKDYLMVIYSSGVVLISIR